MSKKLLFVTVFIHASYLILNASIITVKQDGTGDYTTIEAGMNESAWNAGDTVLVWPGVYYENIYYEGNNLTVASLYLINSNSWYINNTIIDGSQSGNCVTMKWFYNNMTIVGFTIRNGASDKGGGIYIEEAYGYVRNCIIINNSANEGGGIGIYEGQGYVLNCVIENNTANSWFGGGVFTEHSYLNLSGTTIKLNHASSAGGGIYCGFDSYIQFNPDNKCNVYLNYAGAGTDYYKFYSVPAQVIIVDTFTVSNPDQFFLCSYDADGFPVNNVTLLSDHAFLEPVNHDIYVNPVTGDDNNSGISSDEPLKTIAYAYLLIESDSMNPHTIFLSNGIYSPVKNDEKLALGTKSYISLIGEDMDSTIIDADSLSYFMVGLGIRKNYSIENITFQHGRGGIHFNKNSQVTIKNVTIKDGIPISIGGLEFVDSETFEIINTTITNIPGDIGLSIANWNVNLETFSIENCIIDHNKPGNATIFEDGGGIEIIGSSDTTLLSYGKISNIQITENVRIPDPEYGPGMTVGLSIQGYYKIDLINSTIGNNILYGPIGIGTSAAFGAELNIYNSILYGDILKELAIGYPGTNSPASCKVFNNDIEGGEEGIVNWNGINTLVWGDGNIDSDPLWDTAATVPYALPWNSPCVNAGTPMYEFGMAPPFIIQEDTVYKLITYGNDTIVLPLTDLAGNPRVVGGRIDMGAYECQDTTTGVTKYIYQTTKLKVEAHPNPFFENP